MAAPQFAEMLCNHVDHLNDLKSLIPIMTAMTFDIQEIQNIIKCKIRTFNDGAARKLAFDAMPMDALLPMDTVQHMLSFNHFENVKYVCKSFEKCFQQNQQQNQKAIFRSRKRIVEENAHHFAPDISFGHSSGRTYVVRPSGEPLMETLKDLGDDVVIYDDLMPCLKEPRSSSCDRIFVQSGRYEVELGDYPRDDALVIRNRDLQIIGIGENVEIDFQDFAVEYLGNERGFDICGNSKVLFENITVKCTRNNTFRSLIGVKDKSTVWMDRCNLEGVMKVHSDDACAHFKSCEFCSDSYDPAIMNYAGGSVARMTILDCAFTFADSSGCILTYEPVMFVGNRIHGNLDIFCENYYQEEILKSVKYASVLQGNVHKRGGIAHVLHSFHPIR